MANMQTSRNLPKILGALSGLGFIAATFGILVGAMGWFWAGSIVFLVAGVAALILATRTPGRAAATTGSSRPITYARTSEADFVSPPPPAADTHVEPSVDDGR